MRYAPEIRLKTLAAAVLAAALGAGAAFAAEPEPLDQRVERLERLMSSRGLVDMQLRLESLQREMQTLRGQLEEANHLLEEMGQRQRDLYLDLDRRLLQVERSAASEPAAAPEVRAQSLPEEGAGNSSAVAGDPAGEQKAYEKAFDLLRDLRYDQAIQAFREFLDAYPKGRYAHIAQYWLGEANYAQRRFAEAITSYQALLDNYAESPKRAEAMLKIGYSHYELGQPDKAKAVLQKLEREHPQTTEAGQAANLLQKMRSSG